MKCIKFNFSDYFADATYLTTLEHGAYFMLLNQYYLHETEFDNNVSQVFRRAGIRGEEELEAAHSVLSRFFVHTKTGWAHKRCDAEIAAYQGKVKRKQELEQSKKDIISRK